MDLAFLNNLFAGRFGVGTVLDPCAFHWSEILIHSYPVIKDEAVSFPGLTLILGVIQILQDPSSKMIGLSKSLLLEQCSRLFTSDSTSAEHGHSFVLEDMTVRFKSFGELIEL